jgi:hypothetical protein
MNISDVDQVGTELLRRRRRSARALFGTESAHTAMGSAILNAKTYSDKCNAIRQTRTSGGWEMTRSFATYTRRRQIARSRLARISTHLARSSGSHTPVGMPLSSV